MRFKGIVLIEPPQKSTSFQPKVGFDPLTLLTEHSAKISTFFGVAPKPYNQGWGAGKFISGSGSGSGIFTQAAPVPVSDFFPSGSGSCFFQAAPAPRSQKHPAPTGSGS